MLQTAHSRVISLLFCVLVSLYGGQTARSEVGDDDSAAAQLTPFPSPGVGDTIPNPFILEPTPPPALDLNTPLDIAFEGVYPLAVEYRAPIRAALEGNRPLLNLAPRLTVSAYRDIPGWAKVTLVPTVYVENAWVDVETIAPHVVEVILRQTAPSQWDVYIVGTPYFDAVASTIPPAFMDTTPALPPLDGDYRFPWQNGQPWWAIQGWHGGNALDFQPSLSARYAVLAAQSGRLREICSDGFQSLLQIQHADGQSTYYLHVTMSLSVRRRLLDQPVRRGQYLGDLIQQANFRTPCGYGASRHLHFVVSDRRMVFDQYPIAGIADSASCCSNPPVYRASNERVDDSGS